MQDQTTDTMRAHVHHTTGVADELAPAGLDDFLAQQRAITPDELDRLWAEEMEHRQGGMRLSALDSIDRREQ